MIWYHIIVEMGFYNIFELLYGLWTWVVSPEGSIILGFGLVWLGLPECEQEGSVSGVGLIIKFI